MTEAEARARLERFVAHTSAPELDTDDIDALLDIAKRPDSAGLAPADVDWSPTWDLNTAAAVGWEWKAARVAGCTSFAADGLSVSRSHTFRHCLEMAKRFGGSASVAMTSTLAETYPDPREDFLPFA